MTLPSTDLARISATLVDALAEARDIVERGEFGAPLREVLAFARDLAVLADETLAADPHAGEHARGLAMHLAEQLAALDALVGPLAGT
jgi:hypothetical protein